MASSGRGVSREERVEQVERNIPEVNDFKTYIPVDNVVSKLNKWKSQGIEICYLTSRTTNEEVEVIQNLLNKYSFPKSELFYNKEGEEYKDVAERVMPDILIEYDCESIGGEAEMTYPHIKPELKMRIKSIVVKEFSGIDNLPDDLNQLLSYCP